MKHKTIRAVGLGLLVALWAGLAGFSWFGPRTASSQSERRPLKQAPEVSAEAIADGTFMGDFEDFTLDQFPLRDGFRSLKSLFHFYGLQMQDNNNIYIADGYAAKQVYPYNPLSVNYALGRFSNIYDRYLKGKANKVFVTVVPDKGYYLAESAGQLRMDYDVLFDAVKAGMPWAEFIDLRNTLTAQDYYRTDTHWKQEKLLPAATAICEALGVSAPQGFTPTRVDKPFYGVYYGQAALPLAPDELYLMESDVLNNCTVTYHDYTALGPKTGKVYDMAKLESADLYELYLAGARSLITIENPAGQAGKELVVFRDSFGSSMVPLLAADYAKVTLIDIRYITSAQAQNFVSYENADVLFLYSTLVLNESSALRP